MPGHQFAVRLWDSTTAGDEQVRIRRAQVGGHRSCQLASMLVQQYLLHALCLSPQCTTAVSTPPQLQVVAPTHKSLVWIAYACLVGLLRVFKPAPLRRGCAQLPGWPSSWPPEPSARQTPPSIAMEAAAPALTTHTSPSLQLCAAALGLWPAAHRTLRHPSWHTCQICGPAPSLAQGR